jgi:hypothetical protein
MYLHSLPNDYIGQGTREVSTPSNSRPTYTSTGSGNGLQLNVRTVNDRRQSEWWLRFEAPTGQMLVPGS